jgi:hypothetical protein
MVPYDKWFPTVVHCIFQVAPAFKVRSGAEVIVSAVFRYAG